MKRYYFAAPELCYEFYALIKDYISDELEVQNIYVFEDRCKLVLVSSRHSSYEIENRLVACIIQGVPRPYSDWMLHPLTTTHAPPRMPEE